MNNFIKSVFSPHKSQRVQLLPEYALSYFDNLRGEYQSLPEDKITPECRNILNDILKKRDQNNSLKWDDVYTFDLILAKAHSPEGLRRTVWNLRSRYRDVAGLTEYEAYLASNPPELSDNSKDGDLKADIEYLLGQIHLRYAMLPVRDVIRNRLSKLAAYTILVCLFLTISYPVAAKLVKLPVNSSTILFVIFTGAMGGLVSILQRFESLPDGGDPVDNFSELARGWFTIFLSAVTGAVFAAVLYTMICADLLQGELFPAMKKLDIPPKGENGFLWFLQQAGPDKHIDYAKLLLWSFIAGFAERFVPDTLSRFVDKRGTDSGART